MADGYCSKVVRGGWEKTWKPLGWSRERVATAAILGIVTVAGGGLTGLLSSWLGWIIAVPIVGILLFIAGVIETQAAMYGELEERNKVLGGQIEELRRPPVPDYEKWRHVEKMDLRTAAQLWAGETPSMKLIGRARENYIMLQGAAQSGELILEVGQTDDARMQSIFRQKRQRSANADSIVTRIELKAFAQRHGHDPKFLRN